jgi:hypothetical protein
MPFRLRRSVAVLCLAIAVCTAFAPAVTADVACAMLEPVWQYEPPAAVVDVPDNGSRCDEQTAALLRLVLSRAPPKHALA